MSPLFQAVRVLQCHPASKQKCHRDKNVDHLKLTPSSPQWHGQAYLLSWGPLRPLRSLHPGEPDDTLQAREASFTLRGRRSRSEGRCAGRTCHDRPAPHKSLRAPEGPRSELTPVPGGLSPLRAKLFEDRSVHLRHLGQCFLCSIF